MTAKQRINAFVQLGQFLEQFTVDKPWEGYDNGVSQADYEDFNKLIEHVHVYNGWFTPVMVRKALAGIRSWLYADVLEKWLAAYPVKEHAPDKFHTVAVIMAGNIPLVGFHDALCVLITGNRIMAKFSSDDSALMPFLLKYLVQIEPGFDELVRIANDKLTNFDAVIATGSNNSARYFEQYFGKYPHIIRQNRTSVAVIDGQENKDELTALGHDIFDFYGLGCRNVSKLYVPKGYDLDRFFGAIFGFKDVINHKKYGNNYDYHKAIYLMNRDKLIENGFLVLKEDKSLFSPVGILHYEYYTDKAQVEKDLEAHQEEIQCVAGHGHIPFGQTQLPKVDDYADGVDTMRFITGL
jgi:hypothetical protein